MILAELGPGSGALASDLLRAASALPGFRRSLHLHLVEKSPVLRTEQQRRLAFAQPVLVDRIEALPEGPILVVANEFLDALPIRQLVRGHRDWSERMVAIDGEGEAGPCRRPGKSGPVLAGAGCAARYCPPGRRVRVLSISARPRGRFRRTFAPRSGRGVVHRLRLFSWPDRIDFAGSVASRTRGPFDVAERCADLSADGDFAAFADAARDAGCDVYGPVPQGRFLGLLGARERLAALLQRASSAQRPQLESGVERLLDRGQMGDLFKAMALVSPWPTTPVGFDGGNAAVIALDVLTADRGVRHAFFTRQGGVSEGPFHSLNCGFGSADLAENVTRNRAIAMNRLGLPDDRLITCRQIHSAAVVTVERRWSRENAPAADGMVARTLV